MSQTRQGDQMSRTVISGARVFDGESDDIQVADVVLSGGRIVDVGLDLDGDVRVDASGLTVLPGLIDAHVHLMLTSLDMMKMLNRPFSYNFFVALQHLRVTLDCGITTVRDASGADRGIQSAQADGVIEGPRIQISVIALSQTGGHGDRWVPSGNFLDVVPPYPGRPSAIVDGPDEMRRKVRELVRAGANVIKVNTSGGVFSPTDNPSHGHFRDIELEVEVEEAEAAGIYAMAHAIGNAGIKSAVRAGIRSIEHGNELDDEAIEMMLAKGTWLVPTLGVLDFIIATAEQGASLPEAILTKAYHAREAKRDTFRKAAEAGVRIAMGSDSAAEAHGNNLIELRLMHEQGLAPIDCLRAATSSAAKLMRLEDEIGRVAPGMHADLTLIEGDPFDFAAYPSNVTAVYQGGRLVRGGQPASKNSPEISPKGVANATL